MENQKLSNVLHVFVKHHGFFQRFGNCDLYIWAMVIHVVEVWHYKTIQSSCLFLLEAFFKSWHYLDTAEGFLIATMIVLSKVSAALNPLFCHIFSATVRKGLGPTSNFTTIPPQQSTGCFFGIWAPVWVLCSMKNFELWLFIRTTKANGSIYDTSPLLAKVAAIGDACFANMEKFMVSPNVQKKHTQ